MNEAHAFIYTCPECGQSKTVEDWEPKPYCCAVVEVRPQSAEKPRKAWRQLLGDILRDRSKS